MEVQLLSQQLSEFMDSYIVMKKLLGEEVKYDFYRSFDMDRYKIYDTYEQPLIGIGQYVGGVRQSMISRSMGIPMPKNEFCSIHEYPGENRVYAMFTLYSVPQGDILKRISNTGYKKEIEILDNQKTVVDFTFNSVDEFIEMFTTCFFTNGDDLAI
jgi:hypothetical protein